MADPPRARRHAAMCFAELFKREVEVVSISADTTESDLKQRREIVKGDAVFVDQATSNPQGSPRIWASSKALVGIFSQTSGSTCEFWFNPVHSTVGARPRGAARPAAGALRHRAGGASRGRVWH